MLFTCLLKDYPLFQEMIAHAPVCWMPAFNLWLVTRRVDALVAHVDFYPARADEY